MMITPRETVVRAKQLRSQLSLPEGLLWIHLRTRPQGFKFRRQHAVGPFVLDFYCREAAVAIEVDGRSHEMGDNPGRDERRDAWVRARGIATLRIAAAEVLNDVEAVIAAIVDLCVRRAPPPRFARSPSPTKVGEE